MPTPKSDASQTDTTKTVTDDQLPPEDETALSAITEAGLTPDDIVAAHGLAEPAPAHPIEALERRIGQLELRIADLFNGHFGGKLGHFQPGDPAEREG